MKRTRRHHWKSELAENVECYGVQNPQIAEHDHCHLEYHGKRKLEELQVDIPRCQQHFLIDRSKQAGRGYSI